jgi:abequosyltransferase
VGSLSFQCQSLELLAIEILAMINKDYQNNKKILSICILSYNQANEVERVLKSIAPQYISDIEVVIRDDSTNDETKFLVNRFSNLFPIRYFRGEKEGIDKTIIFLTEIAVGDFIWWMGDDVIEPHGISSVLEVIKSDLNLNFIWANYRLTGALNLAIDFNENRYFQDRNELLETAGTALGFISATIFRRKSALTGIEKSKKYIGSAFVNLFLILHVISQAGNLYYLYGPIVVCHPATSEEIKISVVNKAGQINNNGFQVFGINFAKIVRSFEGYFKYKTIRKTIKTSFGHAWRGVLVGVAGGWDTTKEKRFKLIKNFWMYPESWLVLVIFFIPETILKILYVGYKFINKHSLK